jgi:hypothetical protein
MGFQVCRGSFGYMTYLRLLLDYSVFYIHVGLREACDISSAEET